MKEIYGAYVKIKEKIKPEVVLGVKAKRY